VNAPLDRFPFMAKTNFQAHKSTNKANVIVVLGRISKE
jgi:hypothetical protein